MKKTGWIIGMIVMIIVCLLLGVLIAGARTGTESSDGTLTGEDATALTLRANELFFAAVFYTDKVFTVDPSQVSYDEWQETMEKANTYWDALEKVTKRLENGITDETFKPMVKETKGISLFGTKAYAMDSKEILQVFDSAKVGNKFKTLASYLNSDIKYAQAALKMANGEFAAEGWNNYGDTALTIEKTLKAARGAGKVAGVAASVMVAGADGGALAFAATGTAGVDAAMQITSDGAFVIMGDAAETNVYVKALNDTKDSFGKVSGPLAVISSLTSGPSENGYQYMVTVMDDVENLRGILQDGKFAGFEIPILGNDGKTVKMATVDKNELSDYMIADANGQKAPAGVDAIIASMKGKYGDGYGKVFTDITGVDYIEPSPTPTPTPTATPEPTPEPTLEPTPEANEPAMTDDIYGTWFCVGTVDELGEKPFMADMNVTPKSDGFHMKINRDGTAEAWVYNKDSENMRTTYNLVEYGNSFEFQDQNTGEINGEYFLHENDFIYWSGDLQGYFVYQKYK